jgi:hypothetical protein
MDEEAICEIIETGAMTAGDEVELTPEPEPEPLPPLVVREKQLYRILSRLSRGERYVEAGTLSPLEWCGARTIKVLEELGDISEASGPPLGKLPGWKRRGERLAKLGVETIAQLLGTDSGALAAHLGVKLETVWKWKKEAKNWLVASPPKG